MTEEPLTAEEVPHEPQSLLAKAYLSIQTRNLLDLVGQMTEMNQKLTGISGAHFQTQEKLTSILGEFLSKLEKSGYEDVIIHLGDGHSRLAVGVGSDKRPYVYPTYNSFPLIVEKWKDIQQDYERLDNRGRP